MHCVPTFWLCFDMYFCFPFWPLWVKRETLKKYCAETTKAARGETTARTKKSPTKTRPIKKHLNILTIIQNHLNTLHKTITTYASTYHQTLNPTFLPFRCRWSLIHLQACSGERSRDQTMKTVRFRPGHTAASVCLSHDKSWTRISRSGAGLCRLHRQLGKTTHKVLLFRIRFAVFRGGGWASPCRHGGRGEGHARRR